MNRRTTEAAWAPWTGRRIAFFDKIYTVDMDRLQDCHGSVPARSISDLIQRYLAAPPGADPAAARQWCSFRELRGAGPLAVNFAANTHKTIAQAFGSELSMLDCAATAMAGLLEPGQGFDRSYRFLALPEVPLVLNYNAADDLFPAQATLLFLSTTQRLLGIRDIFTLGTYLTGQLIANANADDHNN